MNIHSTHSLSFHLNPFLDCGLLVPMVFATMAVLLLCLLFTRRLPLWRSLTCLLFIIFLLNPSVKNEIREPVPDIAIIVVDDSASQSFGKRNKRKDEALEHVSSVLKDKPNIEFKVVHGPVHTKSADRTDLFKTIEKAYANVPVSRRAGVILITDGQVHDVPPTGAFQNSFGPVHVLLTGDKNEKDRRIEITKAPAFGIVGQDIEVSFKVEDRGIFSERAARVTIETGQGERITEIVNVGEEHSMILPVAFAGQNIFQISVGALAGELTARNNKTAIEFQGVRDRLRVLLVSGKPHAGGRTWRDLLTSDPSVDLVHFTILREPEKIDSTPQSEMSLIAFPFRELFELKLYDFDLIIFDRYKLNRILPDKYFRNIARYVENGGAFLEASGPAFSGEDSIYYTPLRNILPGKPSGEVFHQAFIPKVNDLGLKHPVTANLGQSQQYKKDNEGNERPWGEWSRQVGFASTQGDIVMTGIKNNPLLVLNRVGKGRAAHLASDHLWLWSRGYDGGGPHEELLKRTVHWLMKEPELDEKAINVEVSELDDGYSLWIERSGFVENGSHVTIIYPDGTEETVRLSPDHGGSMRLLTKVAQSGLYRFKTPDGQSSFAFAGNADTPEFTNILTSAEPLMPVIKKSGGKAFWLSQQGQPRVRHVRHIRSGAFYGRDWLALKNNEAYTVKGAQQSPLVPIWGAILALIFACVFTWYREGRKP